MTKVILWKVLYEEVWLGIRFNLCRHWNSMMKVRLVDMVHYTVMLLTCIIR